MAKNIKDQAQYATMLKSILNGMEALICVCELGSFKILFLNDSIRKYFGIEGDGVGQLCHKFLQDQEQPCVLCPYRQLEAAPDNTLIWEHKEAIKGSTLRKTAKIIDWPGGKKAHLEYAIDISELKDTQEELERRERMLDTLNRAAIILLKRGRLEFSAAMSEGISLIAGIANIDRMSVFRNSEQPDGLHGTQLYLWHKKPKGGVQVRERHMDFAYSALIPRWEGILAADQHVSGLVRDMPEADVLHRFGCVSILVVPVFNDGRFWGIVLYEKLRPEEFSSYETDVLRSASFMLATAVLRNEEAGIIREANARAMLMLNATPYGCVLWDQDKKIIDCNDAAVALFGFTKKTDPWERYRECSPEFQPDGQRSDEKTLEVLNRAFSEGKCVFEWMHQSLDGIPIPSEVTLVRVRYGDAFVLAGYIRDLRVERAMEKNILHLESEVEKIYYDPLTGISNRRFFEEHIEGIISSLSRSGSMLSVMMIDIDDFKQYNDTYGHIKGDDCLRIVAQTLRNEAMRKEDIVARYGGEEFVIVLPNTAGVGARMLAGRLLADIRALAIPHEKSRAADCVTISIGMVSGKVQRSHGRDDYLKLADEMLYEAKQGGRNRYAFASL